ncbi:MAG: HU family DNA-binding protein [Paludibacteraceae bacterium]|nr:HU family DNA-binding protein [Paludibacteraceae bacterium]
MNTKELIAAVAAATNTGKKDIAALLEQTTGILTEQLLDGKTVQLKNLGTFCIRERKERVSVIPGKEERLTIPARKQLSFKQAPVLKETLKDVSHE